MCRCLIISKVTAFRIIVALAICVLSGCAKPIQVITVGGLGFSQMGDLRHAIERRCPNADVVSAGWWDAYKSDLPKIIRQSPHRHLVLIGHSLGCQTIAETAEKVSKVDLLVLIDPAWDDIRLPRNIDRSLWYRRADFGFPRLANVTGATAVTIQGGHDAIPHSTELIENVVTAINRIEVEHRR